MFLDKIIQQIVEYVRRIFLRPSSTTEPEFEQVFPESEYASVYRVIGSDDPREVATWIAHLKYGESKENQRLSISVVAWHLRPGSELPEIYPPVRREEKIVRGRTIRVRRPTHRIAALLIQSGWVASSQTWVAGDPVQLGHWDKDLQSIMSYSEDRVASLCVAELARRLSEKPYWEIDWDSEIERIRIKYLRARG